MTFTREQLIERIAEQKKTTVSILEAIPRLLHDSSVSRAISAAEKDLRILEIALAVLESRADAEPAREFLPKNLDRALGVVGVALPESREEFNLQSERWIQRLIDRVIRYADEFKEQPAPVVPEVKCDDDGNTTSEFDHGWNACRAAMLQGKAEPVSQPYTLPECFDLLFKHADGLTFGCDWNRGTAAKYHRDSLIKAVDDCRAMLAAAPQQEAE